MVFATVARDCIASRGRVDVLEVACDGRGRAGSRRDASDGVDSHGRGFSGRGVDKAACELCQGVFRTGDKLLPAIWWRARQVLRAQFLALFPIAVT